MNEEIRLILETNQLIMKDRLWNSQDFRDKSLTTKLSSCFFLQNSAIFLCCTRLSS